MTELFANLGHWQIDGLTFGLLVQGAFFTVFPEEVICIGLGTLCRSGRISWLEAGLSALCGVISANAISVWMGGKLGWALFERKPFSLFFGRAAVADRVREVTKTIRTSARPMIFMTRFTPLIRGPVYLAAGISGVGLRTTVPVDAAAGLIQIPAWICVGMLMRHPGVALRLMFRVLPVVAIVAGVIFLIKKKRAAAAAAPAADPMTRGARPWTSRQIFLPCLLSSALLLVPSPARTDSPDTRASSPDAHALEIARAQPDALRVLAELKREAGKIKDKTLKRDALEILDTPRFQVVADRLGHAGEIETALRQAGLLAGGAHVFPSHAPMAFLAAPGSPWRSHHCYPAGLERHELVNLKTALAAAATYRDVYGIKLNEDWLRAVTIWHDSAKPMTLAWKDDGTVIGDEGQIAGTGAHHVLGVAEAVYRGYDPAFIVTLASAHNPPIAGSGLESLVKYLKAAALIAGKPMAAAGLSDDGSQLAANPPIEAFVNHLSDHDWVLTQVTMPKVVEALSSPAQGAAPGSANGGNEWANDAVLAHFSDVALYQQLLQGGPQAVKAMANGLPRANQK